MGVGGEVSNPHPRCRDHDLFQENCLFKSFWLNGEKDKKKKKKKGYLN